jgi:hypothetical protein
MSPTMSLNPQLPTPAQGAWEDPQYALDVSDLRAQFARDYADTLQQLGYMDDAGNIIPGLVETEAGRQRSALGYSRGLAERGVNEAAQREGTLFSGRLGDRIAEAAHPYVTSLAQLEENLPRQLGTLTNRAQDLISGYGRGLAGAALRASGRYVPPAITPPAPPTGTQPGAPVPGTTGGYYGDPNNIIYSTAENFETTPYYPAGTNIPPAPGAVEELGGGGRRRMARGGFVDEPTNALIGEAGPEAVVPLQDGLRGAIARLVAMYGAQQPQQQIQPGGPNQRAAAPPKPPSVAAAGLKAAAAILREAAKEHEHQGGPTPIQPPRGVPRRVPVPNVGGPMLRQPLGGRLR